jgi:glucose/arabinose dehydrogenase
MIQNPILLVLVAAVVVVVVGMATILSTPSHTTIPLPEPTATRNSNQSNKGIRTIAQNLEVPWAIDIAEDGRIFFTERPGRIRMINSNGDLIDEPVANIRVENIGEAGLLGLAVHPNFTQNHLMYIYHTYAKQGKLYNKVLLLTEKDNKIINSKIIIDHIPASDSNNGGRIKFGPDGRLYISTGDSETTELAQNIKSLAGKILRINPNGAIPEDNPFPDSLVYSYGHSNIEGLAWHPVSKKLFATEQGLAGGNDEINIIQSGKNYGWPKEEECGSFGGSSSSDNGSSIRFEAARFCFNPTIGPSGATFPTSNKLGYQNDIIFATLRGSHLHHIDLETKTQNNVLVGYGRVRDVIEAPDGSLYVLTSNKDEQGIGETDDDKILQIIQPR